MSAKTIENRPELVGSYALLAGAELLGAGLGFLAVLLVARTFGPDGLGEVSLAVNIVGYAAIFATCGTIESSVCRVAGRPERLRSQVTDVILLRTVLASVTYLAMLLVVRSVPQLAPVMVLTTILGLTLFLRAIDVSWIPLAFHRTAVLASSQLARQALNLSVLWFALLRFGSLESVVWSRLVSELGITVALGLWLVRRVAVPGSWSGLAALGDLIRNSVPIAGTKLIRALGVGSDLVVVGVLVDANELGIFSAAIRIFMLLVTLSGAYFMILLPRLVEARSGGLHSLRRGLTQSLSLALPAAALALGCVALIARPLLIGLFGQAYAGAAPALRWLCLSLWFNVSAQHLRQTLLVLERQRLDFVLSLLVIVIHIGVKIPLTMSFGITGAAFATVVGEILMVILLSAAVRSCLKRATGFSPK